MFQPDKLKEFISTDRATARKVEVPALDEIGQRLMRAAEIIQQRGWTQNVACNHRGEVCLMGAIYDVQRPSDCVPPGAFNGASKAAAAFMISRGRTAAWNDSAGRTSEEVLSELRAAIKARAAQ